MKAQLSFFAVAVILINAAWMSPASTPDRTPASASASVAKKINPSFTFLRTHRQARNVVATWGLSSTEGVIGFIVEKTYEDPTDPYAYWECICNLPCAPARSFTTKDTQVFPGFIHYRITAQMDNGSSVVSEISTVHIVSK